MGSSTEDLVKACKEAAIKTSKAQDKAVSTIKSLNTRTDAYCQAKIKDMKEFTNLKKDRGNAVKVLTEFKASIGGLEKAAKALSLKIKVKDVLNVFKTQKSLDDAKKVLQQTEKAASDARDVFDQLADAYNERKVKFEKATANA